MLVVDRKAELARKKAKLAALREERLKKEDNQYKIPPAIINSNDIGPSGDSIDGILRELGVSNVPSVNAKSEIKEMEKSASTSALLSHNGKTSPKLAVSNIAQCYVDPQELIVYSKQVQTEQNQLLDFQSPTIDRWNDDVSRTHLGLHSFEWDDDIGANIYEDQDSVLPEVAQLIKHLDLNKSVRFSDLASPAKQIPPHELTEDEKQVTMESDGFQDFFLRTSRIVERALEDENDIFFDYSGADRVDTQGKDQLIKYSGEFFDKSYVGASSVVALDWSAVHPELLLVAYQSRDAFAEGVGGGGGGVAGSCEGGGSCLIWNLKYRQTAPEYSFTYQVDITTAILTPFNPSVVIGGTRGGQIVLWDSRVNRRTPVQKTRLGGTSAHVEAISGLAVTGSRNANSLISVSSDGRLCSWSLDMLGAPQQTLDLAPTSKRTANSVTPTCLTFLPGDANRFLVGAQDGNVYAGSRHGKSAGISDQFTGHKAPLTSLAVMPNMEAAMGQEDPLSPLFVTTAMDCSVKLWSHREPAYPLLSYDDRNDYFVGCDYSPLHPALFATTDLGGALDLWSLNMDHEVPTASVQIEGDTVLNRCRFHKKGFHLAVGGDDGHVRLFELHENLAMPKVDEWTELNRLVRNLTNNASEQREYDVRYQRASYSHSR